VNVARAVAPSHAPSPARAARPVKDAAEREAERAGEAAARATLPTRWSFGAVPVSPPPEAAEPDARATEALAGPGRALDAATRAAMEARFRADLSTVRVHDDARTAAATRAAGARGIAVGDEIALAERLDPASPRSRELLGHELAHVVQQRAAGSVAAVQRKDGPAAATPATTLEGLPDADRQRIQVTTTKVTIPDLAGKFATTGTKSSIPLPSGLTAAFDASVDAAIQAGLTSVAASLTTTTELTEVTLAPNSTITLELDVGKPFGKGLYRFTHHAPAGTPGAKGAAKPAARVLVEALGKATAPPGTKPPTPQAGQPAAPDPVADKIKSHSFSGSASYKDAELDALRAALAQIPDAQLAIVDGLTFARDTASTEDPTADGDYQYKTHTVTMYDKAFPATQTRVKGPGSVASDSATRAIVHEIGHAIDLAPIRKARLEQAKADAAVEALYKKYRDPKKPTELKYPTGGAEEEEVKTVLGAQEAADKKVLAARSLSGSKTVKKGTDFEDVIGTDVKGIKFREAAAKDGGKAVTAYGSKDFQEAFAEAYSLYITAPNTLKALRPNVFDYLDQNLPK
jgi:Domain of unknown function (DUF4157)